MGLHMSSIELVNDTDGSKRHRKVTTVRLTHYEGVGSENIKFSMDYKNSTTNEKRRKKHTTVSFKDSSIKVLKSSKEIATYCLPLLSAHFVGETSNEHTDQVDTTELGNLHLGVYLQLVDDYLRQFQTVQEFTGTEEFYLKLLSYIAMKRRISGESHSQCYQRLLADSKRFVAKYHQRGLFSQELKDHKGYWGSRQQLLSGKVISDWIDRENGPLDPIFGALLQPTTGRAGPGDSGWFHHMMFDDDGHIAYHSAVHDAFGYLINFHSIGPGYDYMHHSHFNKSNPLAGQLDGVSFWKNVIHTVSLKQDSLDLASSSLDRFHWHHKKVTRHNDIIF